MSEQPRTFVVRFSAAEDELVGARWWNDAFKASGTVGRRHLAYWIGGGALALALTPFVCDGDDDDDDDIQSAVDALELQRREGWNVGQTSARLVVPHATVIDADGASTWKGSMPMLSQALAPLEREERLRPYYVPTLFQVLQQPGAHPLREALYPMHGPDMDTAFDKAQALGALVADANQPKDMAVILDLFGPDSVAAAAALADRLAPVFVFDNWPHPLGVVPAHQTLAAALYYQPRFLRAAQNRPPDAPPVFVLDDARLAPYRDDASQFDNRYMARLPTADGWKKLGISRLLYVRPAGTTPQELDDLNDDFVAFRNAGLDVKLVSLGDFQPGAAPKTAGAATRQYWGGSPQTHVHFWPMYGWYRPLRSSWTGSPLPLPRARTAPPALPRSVSYQPAARTTLFSNRAVGGLAGIGKQKPSGFGRVSVRTSRRTGALTGVSSGRSGSFGRSRSSYSG